LVWEVFLRLPLWLLFALVGLMGLWSSLGCAADEPAPPEDGRGKIIHSEKLTGYALDELIAKLDSQSPLITLAVEPEFDVEVHRVIYATVDAHGNDTEASGVVVIPSDATHALGIASYQHGTLLRKSRAPSVYEDGERLIALGLAGAGYLAVAPDYLGLGLSELFHPYVHADSEATATIDMMRAARRLAGDQGFELSGKVFLFGYSQGGHATMATAMTIETHTALRKEFALSGVAPMAGPYDVSGVQAEVISSDEPYPEPSYLPYVLMGYDSVYDIFDHVGDIVMEPYASHIEETVDGKHGFGEVNAGMPNVPSRIFKPEVLQAFKDDPEHPLRQVLAKNDLYDWKPTIPLRMYHCEGDDHVVFGNAQVALTHFEALGSTTVELKSMGADLDHEGCVMPSLLDVKAWFDSIDRGP
jgi:pimeloyl-ACP methyl ester carboxylesterase